MPAGLRKTGRILPVMANVPLLPDRAVQNLQRMLKTENCQVIQPLEKKGKSMTKSELIERIVEQQGQLSAREVEQAIKTMLDQMTQALSAGERIEIRGFGSFSLHYRAPRVGRNPKTGEAVSLDGKYVPHFKPGKELRDRVND